jgi:hypothetical protein
MCYVLCVMLGIHQNAINNQYSYVLCVMLGIHQNVRTGIKNSPCAGLRMYFTYTYASTRYILTLMESGVFGRYPAPHLLLAPGSWHNVGVHSQTYDIDALK